jgi:hypothetical protein
VLPQDFHEGAAVVQADAIASGVGPFELLEVVKGFGVENYIPTGQPCGQQGAIRRKAGSCINQVSTLVFVCIHVQFPKLVCPKRLLQGYDEGLWAKTHATP